MGKEGREAGGCSRHRGRHVDKYCTFSNIGKDLGRELTAPRYRRGDGSSAGGCREPHSSQSGPKQTPRFKSRSQPPATSALWHSQLSPSPHPCSRHPQAGWGPCECEHPALQNGCPVLRVPPIAPWKQPSSVFRKRFVKGVRWLG